MMAFSIISQKKRRDQLTRGTSENKAGDVLSAVSISKKPKKHHTNMSNTAIMTDNKITEDTLFNNRCTNVIK